MIRVYLRTSYDIYSTFLSLAYLLKFKPKEAQIVVVTTEEQTTLRSFCKNLEDKNYITGTLVTTVAGIDKICYRSSQKISRRWSVAAQRVDQLRNRREFRADSCCRDDVRVAFH